MSRRPSDRPISVLIVDDIEDVRDLYQEYLRFHGFHVTAASNGSQALSFASKYPPDVIILDLGMPGMTGWEVLRALKKGRPAYTGAVVVLTGFPGLFATGDALDCRADAYLMKPCLPADLLGELHRVVKVSRARVRSK